MKRMCSIVFVLVILSVLPLAADGGGGVDYIMNFGSNTFPSFASALSGDVFLDVPTGSITGIGGFGYGVTYSGFKIGGYGLSFWSTDFSKEIDFISQSLTRVAGGVGGVISGTQGGFGPFVLSMNTRLGAGGIGVQTQFNINPAYPFWSGAFVLHGALDAEAGILLGRNMLVSAYAGINGFLAFNMFVPVVPMLVPTAGLRVTWGSF